MFRRHGTNLQEHAQNACQLLHMVLNKQAKKMTAWETHVRLWEAPHRNDAIMPLQVLRAQLLNCLPCMQCPLRLHDFTFGTCMQSALFLSTQPASVK